MALVLNVSYANTSDANKSVWMDASFKTIGDTIPITVNIDVPEFPQGATSVQTSAKTLDGSVIDGAYSISKHSDDGGAPYYEMTIPGRHLVPDASDRTIRRLTTPVGESMVLDNVSEESQNLIRVSFLQSRISSEAVEGTWKFQFSPRTPMVNNTLKDEKAVKNALNNIFTFSQKERIILPDFGNPLGNIVGQRITDGQRMVAIETVGKMLNWDKRVSVENVDVRQLPDSNTVTITVQYSIPTAKVFNRVETISLTNVYS